jgi:hypothetical protein
VLGDRRISDDGDRLLVAGARGRRMRAVGQRVAEETPQDDHAHHDNDGNQGRDHTDADTASAVAAVTATPLAAAAMAAGKRLRWRSRWPLAAPRKVGEVIRRVDLRAGEILLVMLRLWLGVIAGVVARGLGVIEKPWNVRKVVGVLVGRAIRKARTGDRTGVPRLGKVVRRFAGRLVRIGSSVPTHAGALPHAEGACRL